MFCKFKSVVVFLKILTCLLISRSFGNFIHDIAAKYDHISIADLRKLEKISIRSRKAELYLNFSRNCQSFNVFPKFLCFNLPNTSRRDTITIRKQLLRSAIAKRSKELRKLICVRVQLTARVQGILNSVDFYILNRTLHHNVTKATTHFVKTHHKKLKNLTRNKSIPFTSDETVTNLSSHSLTPEQLNILKFGLTQCIRPVQVYGVHKLMLMRPEQAHTFCIVTLYFRDRQHYEPLVTLICKSQ